LEKLIKAVFYWKESNQNYFYKENDSKIIKYDAFNFAWHVFLSNNQCYQVRSLTETKDCVDIQKEIRSYKKIFSLIKNKFLI